MAMRPMSVCRHAGCGKLVEASGHCPVHAKALQRQSDARRGSAHERGYNVRWQKARVTYLSRNPLCVRCDAEGRIAAASVVDHIVPHKGDQDVFWDTSNWQSLCARCHNVKTSSEDGGFGR